MSWPFFLQNLFCHVFIGFVRCPPRAFYQMVIGSVLVSTIVWDIELISRTYIYIHVYRYITQRKAIHKFCVYIYYIDILYMDVNHVVPSCSCSWRASFGSPHSASCFFGSSFQVLSTLVMVAIEKKTRVCCKLSELDWNSRCHSRLLNCAKMCKVVCKVVSFCK